MTEEKKQVLVVDDNPLQIKAAEMQFVDGKFDLTTARNYVDAYNWICEKQDQGKAFYAVLTDLFFPLHEGEWPEHYHRTRQIGKEQFIEMPFGLPLVFHAAKNRARYIAVITDGNHHYDAMVEQLLDRIPKRKTTEGTKNPYLLPQLPYKIEEAECMFFGINENFDGNPNELPKRKCFLIDGTPIETEDLEKFWIRDEDTGLLGYDKKAVALNPHNKEPITAKPWKYALETMVLCTTEYKEDK